MIPFLCEIALGCIVSYHIALLLVQRERTANQESDSAVAASQPHHERARFSQGLSSSSPSDPDHPLATKSHQRRVRRSCVSGS